MRGWPLVGRDQELARVSAALAGDGAHGVVVAGPAGVGKTRVAEEVVAGLRDGWAVRRVRATRAAAAIPLGAFATLLPIDSAHVENDAARLRHAADAMLESAPGTRPLVFVDDCQSLDDASAALLLALAASGRAAVLTTLRTGERMPDAVTGLWRDGLLERVDVAPFAEDQTRALLRVVLDGEVDGLSAAALHRASGGNLLYLRELVSGLLDSGMLAEADGLWVLLGPITAPTRLSELITDRLAGLDDDDRLVLQRVVVGEPIGLAQAERSGWGDAVERLERRGLAEVVEDGRRREIRVAHPMFGQVVSRGLTARGRRQILLDMATAIEESGARRREDPRRIAHLRLEAGAHADGAVLLAAARDARAADDYSRAERYARAAFEQDPGFDAAYMLSRCLDQLGRHEEAEQVYEAAALVATSELERAQVALGRSENLFRGLGRAQEAYGALEAGRRAVRDVTLRDELTGQQAMFELFEGRVGAVLELVDPLLERREDDRAYCHGALQASMALLLAGQVVAAVEMSQRAFDVRVRLGDQVQMSHPGVFLVAHALALAEDGRIEDAIAVARSGYEAAVGLGSRDGQGWFASALGKACLYAGRLEEAGRAARETALAFGAKGHPGARWGKGALCLALGHRGDAAGAVEALSELDAQPATLVVISDGDIERGRAWVRAASGDLAGARATALAAADWAAARGQRTVELAALHDIARLGAAPRVVERAREVARAVDGGLAPVRLAFIEGMATDDADALDGAAERFGALGANLWAAEAATEAAVLHRAAGESRRANHSAGRARAWRGRCERAATPMLAHGLSAAVLTRREREIASLAAAGLTNRQIAERLVVSPRTVENQLQRAYEKLGINRRDDVAAALRDHAAS